jgi:hypothetical protein
VAGWCLIGKPTAAPRPDVPQSALFRAALSGLCSHILRAPTVSQTRCCSGHDPARPIAKRHLLTISVRAIVFPGDQRKLMDMRRSGAVEAIAGGADAVGLSAKLANSIGRSNALHKTYAPVDIEAVRNTDEARLQGRRKIRAANEPGPKVSTPHPIRVSTERPKRG